MLIHNRVENYNPRQRRLRNLVVEEEKTAPTPSQPGEGEGPPPRDIISVVIQPGTIVVEEVVSTQGEEGAEFQVFSCPLCSLIFSRRLELRLHTVSHTGEMPYKCTSCTEQFMQKKDLKSHLIKIHGAPKPHACSLCPKCFLSRTELRLHEASKHRGEKLFVCEECGHRASSRNGLQMHIKAIHR
ncbi:Zinc finger and BTB domain-containing protein 48 [Acipenser ruthenus]|uniref:Zinc finger and BTB domain-containing protein 48 n=1 Tax=Acipenser ruthenus TaxID=7906 RepID=A0A444V2D6_ACIRT|nr:Zinc finger and BTB domain-containing protein 48 [Acipenser ruthenus]